MVSVKGCNGRRAVLTKSNFEDPARAPPGTEAGTRRWPGNAHHLSTRPGCAYPRDTYLRALARGFPKTKFEDPAFAPPGKDAETQRGLSTALLLNNRPASRRIP